MIPDPTRELMLWDGLFSAFAVVILLVAAVIAYEAHETRPAPVSQIVAR
jgi:hypothetical protein